MPTLWLKHEQELSFKVIIINKLGNIGTENLSSVYVLCSTTVGLPFSWALNSVALFEI